MGIRNIEALTMNEKWHWAIFQKPEDKHMLPACNNAQYGDTGQTENRDKVTCSECLELMKESSS